MLLRTNTLEGYEKGVKGQVLNDAQLWELVEGLRENGIDFYSHVINGYIGSDSFLIKLAEVINALKKRNPKLVAEDKEILKFGRVLCFS